MNSFHGQCISIANANQLPGIERGQFLDRDLQAKVACKVAKGEDLLFLGNDVVESKKSDSYQLVIHGILPCGSKTTLAINGIEPHVDVRIHPDESDQEAVTRMKGLVKRTGNESCVMPRITIRSGKDFLYFDHNTNRYARLYFKTLKNREDFIAVCDDEEIKTYSNDKSTYYRVVSRGYEIYLSSWNLLRNYSRDFSSRSKAQYCLSIDINDIKPMEDNETLLSTAALQGFDSSIVKYENMILSSFDIEMIPENPNRFPDADKNPNDSIFMICMTYHFAKRETAIFSVCLTLKECDPLDSVYMVHCKSETCLLASFAKFMSMLQPDFITEFNGGGFDWRNIITKARYCGIISTFLENMSIVRLPAHQKTEANLKWFHKESTIKIGGATAPAICKGLKMQGFVGFDTLVVFKQLDPNADSHKLNECLRTCNLGSKDDLDIQEMFRIYREGTSTEMRLVAHYCFIDTFKLQQLLLKKNVIQERREVSTLSFTSLRDIFFYAGGGRMRNLLMNRGEKLGFYFDTKYRPAVKDSEAKFPGAYVVPPIKGIVKPMHRLDEFMNLHNVECDAESLQEGYNFIEEHFEQMYHSDIPIDISTAPKSIQPYIEYTNQKTNEYPVSGLDYASLYPSIIMTYNISPEKLIIDEAYASQLEDMGYVMQFVSFPFCGDIVKAWFVRHENNESEYSICGKLLIELFERRASIKKILECYEEKILDMEAEMKPFIEQNNIDAYPRLAEYNEAVFDYVGYDSKQKAVKVFMNTLYGEMGNFKSCICAVEVSASVTTMGRYNLQLAKSFVESEQLNMKVHYGDTDSLYVACNQKHFIKNDCQYFTGRIDKLTYGTRLVETTFEQIETAKKLVNVHLIKDNGSQFLKMAYEEVLYPVAFLCKKKYYGVPHVKNVNFYPKKLFLRGLEVVKRGASDVLKDIINEVLREVMDIMTTRDIIDIIKDAIARVFNTNWNIESFAKTKSYRPDKKNISVITMMDRYKALNYHTIPEPNVRFKYVICKYYPWEYDIQGRIKSKMTIGHRMELVERVREEGLEIDLEYYFDNELTGQFARLITFCDEFKDVVHVPLEVDTTNMTDIEMDALLKENYQKAEDGLFKAAKKFIGQLAKHYSKAYVNKGTLFSNTWREVCSFIQCRQDIQRNHLNASTAIVMNMFVGSTKNIQQDLFNWCTQYMLKKYNTTLSESQEKTLLRHLKPIVGFARKNNLEETLTDCVSYWKCRVVQHIREEFDYEFICKNNLPYKTIWDVMSPQELEIILRDESLFSPLTSDQAMTIIDMLSFAVGQALTVDQLSRKYLKK